MSPDSGISSQPRKASSSEDGAGALLRLVDENAVLQLLNSVRDYAIFLLTPDGRIASWNTGAERIKGYRADEIIGKHFSVFYPPDALLNNWPAQELVWAKDRGTFEDEGWRVRKDGSLFWANVVISAVVSAEGELLGFSKVTRDLTERRQQEKLLEASERNIRLLVDAVQDYAIFQLDPEGVITSWNTGAQRIKGYAPEEAVGRHFSMFYPPEVVESGWPSEELQRATQNERFEDEGWRVRKDGSRFWANVVLTAIRDEHGTLLGFSKVTRDLTERRAQEEALRESEQGMRLLVEGTRGHAMFLLGLEGRVRSWNSGAARLLGYVDDEARGLDYAAFFAAKDQEAGRPATALEKALSTGFAESQGWRRRADGHRIWCECNLTLLRSAAGEPSGFVALVRDLSERQQVEQLQAEGARMTQFMATLSHELRNPLAPIRHALEALGRRAAEPGVKWASEVIDRQVTVLTRLVDDLLDLSRVTSGRMQLQTGPVDLASLVRAAVSSSAALMRSHKHHLSVEVPQESVRLNGDATRLTQVLTNLLNNAAKYTPPGGHISVSLNCSAMAATVKVTDSGVGMTESMLQLAFEPFVQAERTLERSEGGMGIGLALVKRIVELHKGSVSLASPGVGMGTTVTVQLPLLTSQQMESSQPVIAVPVESPTLRNSRRILVVDDNVDAAESLAALLKDEGQDTEVAFDGLHALAVAADFRPDIVLLDVGLPDMSGLEVAAKLRATPGLEAVTLVAVTGYGQPGDIAATKAAGFNAHLTKPFDFHQLIALLADGPSASNGAP